MKNFKIEKLAETRELITFTEPNSKGEKIAVEFTKCIPDNSRKYSLPRIWKKNGHISKLLNSYWCIDTYVTDDKGCWGRYNPQTKLSDDGKRSLINFDFMLEATEENKQLLLDEIVTRAFN